MTAICLVFVVSLLLCISGSMAVQRSGERCVFIAMNEATETDLSTSERN